MLYTTEYPYTLSNCYETDNVKIIVNGFTSDRHDINGHNIFHLLQYDEVGVPCYNCSNIMYEFKTQTIIPKAVHYKNNDTCSGSIISVYGYNDNTKEWNLLCSKTVSREEVNGGWRPIVFDFIIDTDKSYSKIKITDTTKSNFLAVQYFIIDYEPSTGRMIKNKVKNVIMQNEMIQKLAIPCNIE